MILNVLHYLPRHDKVEVLGIERNLIILGLDLAWFLLVQVFAGLLLSLGMLASATGSKWYQILATIHAGENPLESVYRVALGLATVVQVALGIAIFFLSRKRQERGKRV